MRAARADISLVTGRLVRAAIAIGVCVAAAHLLFAPPPQRIEPPSRGLARERFDWTEWRDEAFFARAAALDRSDPVAVAAGYIDAFRRADEMEALAYCSDRFHRYVTPRSLASTIRLREDGNEIITEFTLSDAHVEGDAAIVRSFERLSNGTSRVRRMRVVYEADAWAFDGMLGRNRRGDDTRNFAPPVVRDGADAPPETPDAAVDAFLDALRSDSVANIYVLCSERLQRDYTPADVGAALALYAPTPVRDAPASVRIETPTDRARAHIDFQLPRALVTLSIVLTHDADSGAWWIDEILPNDAYNVLRTTDADDDEEQPDQ